MRIERVSGKDERKVAIAMIVDPLVLGRIAGRWSPDLFKSKWANIVGDFCVRYFNRYKLAPGKAVEGLFEAWATEQKDKATVELVEKFLASLSEEYENLAKESNSSYVIDVAARHFDTVRLLRLVEQVGGMVDSGQVDKAVELVDQFSRVQMSPAQGINVLWDREALEKAFAERAQALIALPGGLGLFFGRSLQRGGFISFLAPEKRGKTAWLVYLSWMAMRQRLKVAFFSVGDENEEEMMLRFAVLAAKHPLHAQDVVLPTCLERDGSEIKFDSKVVKFTRDLTALKAYKAFKKTAQYRLRSKREFLRLSVHPNSSISIKGIESQLQEWAKEGWTPDVLVIDYMDILLESGTSQDQARDRINATWKEARGMAQRWSALVLTATQANAASYDESLITRKNFAEDKRKLAHVTGMAGINQNDTEKDNGRSRLNWVVGRGFAYNSGHCVHCAGSLAIANPAMLSCL